MLIENRMPHNAVTQKNKKKERGNTYINSCSRQTNCFRYSNFSSVNDLALIYYLDIMHRHDIYRFSWTIFQIRYEVKYNIACLPYVIFLAIFTMSRADSRASKNIRLELINKKTERMIREATGAEDSRACYVLRACVHLFAEPFLHILCWRYETGAAENANNVFFSAAPAASDSSRLHCHHSPRMKKNVGHVCECDGSLKSFPAMYSMRASDWSLIK